MAMPLGFNGHGANSQFAHFSLTFLEGKSTRVITKRDRDGDVTYVETGLFHNGELDIGIMEVTPKQNFDESLLEPLFDESNNVLSGDRKKLTFVGRSSSQSVQCIIRSETPIENNQRFDGEDSVIIVRRSETASSVVLSFSRQRTQSGTYRYDGVGISLLAGSTEHREYDVEQNISVTIKEKGFFNSTRGLDSYAVDMAIPQKCQRERVITDSGSESTTQYESGFFKDDYLVDGIRSHFFMSGNESPFITQHFFGKFALRKDGSSQKVEVVCHDPNGKLYQELANGVIFSYLGVYAGVPQTTEIYRHFMLVHQVHPQEGTIEALSPVPVRHNAQHRPCFASFFQPAHIQSGAPCPSFNARLFPSH